MPTTKQLETRLRFPVGRRRARKIAESLHGNPNWRGHEVESLVILRSDFVGFREWVAGLLKESGSAQLALDFLCQMISLTRRLVLEHGGLFERQHGDRTTSIFARAALLPGDEVPAHEPWSRAAACGASLLAEYPAVVSQFTLPPELPAPALRVVVVGMSPGAGTAQVVNAVVPSAALTPEVETLPPEIFSVAYEISEGSVRCLHAIADGLCEIASDEGGWRNLYMALNRSSAQEAEALWRSVVRGRQRGMLLLDHTFATADLLSAIELDLAVHHPRLSPFSFLPFEAGDAKIGRRRVAIAGVDNNLISE